MHTAKITEKKGPREKNLLNEKIGPPSLIKEMHEYRTYKNLNPLWVYFTLIFCGRVTDIFGAGL